MMTRKKWQYVISILVWGASLPALLTLGIGLMLYNMSFFHAVFSVPDFVILWVFVFSFYPWYRLWVMNMGWLENKKLGLKKPLRDLLLGCVLLVVWVFLFEDMIILVAILPMSFLALSFAGYLCYWHGKMR